MLFCAWRKRLSVVIYGSSEVARLAGWVAVLWLAARAKQHKVEIPAPAWLARHLGPFFFCLCLCVCRTTDRRWRLCSQPAFISRINQHIEAVRACVAFPRLLCLLQGAIAHSLVPLHFPHILQLLYALQKRRLLTCAVPFVPGSGYVTETSITFLNSSRWRRRLIFCISLWLPVWHRRLPIVSAGKAGVKQWPDCRLVSQSTAKVAFQWVETIGSHCSCSCGLFKAPTFFSLSHWLQLHFQLDVWMGCLYALFLRAHEAAGYMLTLYIYPNSQYIGATTFDKCCTFNYSFNLFY